MSERILLSDAHRTDEVRAQLAAFHPEVVARVRAAVETDEVVVVGMAQNPFVRRARRALDAAGQPFTYLEFGSYLARWHERLAIKMWSGYPTYPQVFVRGVLIGGFRELSARLDAGALFEGVAPRG